MISLGIDIGSSAIKSVLLKDDKIIAHDMVITGGNNKKQVDRTCNNICAKAGMEFREVDKIVTTGYGRNAVSFSSKAVSEIICHAKGMHFINPRIKTILDIGGQDTKAIRLDDVGNISDFVMNDKCAAGCGKFLEVVARSLELELGDLGKISNRSTQEKKISSMCVVFAETEIVSLVAQGTPVEDIVKGVISSISDRAISLMKSVGLLEPIGMCGGVTNNIGVIETIEEKLQTKLLIPENAQHIGALGAAIIAHNG